MSHFVFAMKSGDPAPASGGTTKGWFFHYKWEVGGEAFVPFPESAIGEPPVAGDTLWFLLDEHPIGLAPILRVQEDSANSCIELYYDTCAILESSEDELTLCSCNTGKADGPLSAMLDVLMRACVPRTEELSLQQSLE